MMKKTSKKLKMLFVADPLQSFNPQAETTLFLMHEAFGRGHEVWFLEPKDILSKGRKLIGQVKLLQILHLGKANFWKVKKEEEVLLEEFDWILLRKDPPFDLAYLTHLQLLLELEAKVHFLNSPSAILKHPEKMIPQDFKAYSAETLITQNKQEMLKFAKRFKQGVILKPLHLSGGRGVFHFKQGDSNFLPLLESMSNEPGYWMLQEYLSEVQKGDCRVVLLKDQILGHFLRVPSKGSHRANLHSGGRLQKNKLSSKQKEISLKLASYLSAQGLNFVGLDFIGDYLSEVNVTSPMGINEINITQKGCSQKQVIDFMESEMK